MFSVKKQNRLSLNSKVIFILNSLFFCIAYTILKKTLGEDDFLSDLGWLLPVPFHDNLDDRGIFDKVGTNKVFESGTVPALF